MTERIEPATLLSQSEILETCISPDGKHVVYKTRLFWNRDGDLPKSTLWIAEIGKENSARQLNNGDHHEYSLAYSPDGKYISFLSDRSKPGQASVLYLLSIDGGEALPLTSTDNEMGVQSYAWRPDSKAIAFSNADEKSEERKAADKKSDVKVHDDFLDMAKLRVLDMESKEVTTLKTVEDHVVEFAWNEKGTELAYTTWKGPGIGYATEFGANLHILNVQDKSTREIGHSPTGFSYLSWNKEKVLFLRDYEYGQWISSKCVFTVDPAESNPEQVWTKYGETSCVNEMKARNGKVVLREVEGLKDVLTVLDGEEIFAEKLEIMSWDVNLNSSQPIAAMSYSTVGKPAEMYSVVNGQKTQLSQHGKSLADKDIGEAHLCEYTHEDGTPIDGYYSVPTSLKDAFAHGKPSPTIVLVHGGPSTRVTNSFDLYFRWAPFLTSLGYLVLIPNYRGGISHGHKYSNVLTGDASLCYQDIVWLVKKGIEEGRIDKDRVGLTGWSFGGYISFLALTRDDDFHFAAIAPGAGITDYSTISFTSDIPSYFIAASGTLPWLIDDVSDVQARKCSPIYYMKNIRSPALILHGEKDQRCPIEQAVGFYRGMRARGKEVTLVTYPQEGHGFPMPFTTANNIDMLERLEKFFGKHLGKP